jgi:translocation and assembly module TamA
MKPRAGIFVPPLRAGIITSLSLAGTVHAATAVSGADGELLENVRLFLDEPDCDASTAVVRRYARELPAAVRPALEAFGYYDARLRARRTAATADCWTVELGIEPGTPVTVRDAAIELEGEAAEDTAMRALVAAFPLPSGSTLHHGLLRDFKSRLAALARERGYFDARFTEERLDVYVREHAADLALTFDSGRRYAFGEVTFGTDALRPDVLASFVPFEPGDPYDAGLVADLQRALTASEYFVRARVSPQFDAAEGGVIPIEVDAEPAEPKSSAIGVGFSTDDGPRFSYSRENVRRNLAGHRYELDVLLSAVRQNATFDYRMPIGDPLRDWWGLRAGVEREDIDAGVGSVIRLGPYRVHAEGDRSVTRFVDLLVERDQIGGGTLDTKLVLPGISWARSFRDDLVRPREGYRLSYGVALGVGDVELVQSDLRAKWVTALPWEARVILRGRAGVILEDNAFDRVPLSLRFFSGGDNSVRGYDYESLGPRNAAGELIGGNRVFEASVEYEHPVTESWSVAAFVDTGNAFLGSDFELRTGAGIGARWFTPIGPIRLDVAWPVNTAFGEDDGPRLHISLGPDL